MAKKITFIQKHRKLLFIIIPLILIILFGLIIYQFLSSKDAADISSTIAFDKTISNNFVNPQISANISGRVKPGDEVRVDVRGGVGSLTVNGTNFSLTITPLSFESESAVHYESVTTIQNDRISNLFRTQDPKDWYLEGYFGWHYSNALNNSECSVTSSGIPAAAPCGSAKIEKDNARFEVACNFKGDSSLVKGCDDVMKTLVINID